MSQEDTCKPRFKGIENFLRRIAFNLGNSPSQTEVKIISCIPIDVTDLQQKILFLEKELSDAKKQKSTTKHKNKFDCNRFDSERRAMYDSSTANRSIAVSQCDNNPSLDFDYNIDRNSSNISFEFSTHSKPIIEAIYERSVSEQSVTSKWDQRKFIANKYVRNIFKKRKKMKQTQDRGQTQFVYYAHTDYGPNLPRENKLSHSYLSDVFRKHYDPKLVLHEYSDTSHFSEPICRDLKHRSRKLSPHDSEVCSCCHGRFQNVDIYMNDVGINEAAVFQTRATKKVKNEPSLVDLVPVKEKFTKNKPKLKNAHRKLKMDYNTSNADWWPEHEDTKHKCCYKYPTENNIAFQVSKQTKCKHLCKEHSTYNKTGHGKTSNVYKDLMPVTKPHRKDKVKKSLKENISSSQIKTAIYDCTKTEAMLNEIKKMLRSVLSEIKANTEMRYIKDDKTKRDAVIQNDNSRNNMKRSTFLHSFMYNNSSNYCTNPYLLPYAGQVPLTQYCFSNMPFQPMKYPSKVIPQTCTLCPKMTTTRSTNTDNEENIESKNNETGRLIKEIYKSVNTNADNPSNDESCHMNDLRTTTNDSIPIAKTKCACKDASLNVSNSKKDAQVEALLSSLTSYTASNVVYTAITKSGYDTKENVVHRFNKSNDIYEEDEYTETVSTSDVTKSVKDAKKTGVLTKMFSVFKKKKSNRDEETEISDTDDYETVYTAYTDKANNTPKTKRPAAGINIRVPASRNKNKRKSEEECRRRWIEDLLNEESRYYAPKNKTQSFKSYPKPVYVQDYEARAAFVVPKYNNYKRPNRPKYENANKMCKLPIGRNKMSYLKNRKLMRCGRDWKKFILES